jgi:hypothetical protein
MTVQASREMVPVATAALRWRLAREIVIRRIQTGKIRGEQREGKWYAEVPPEEDHKGGRKR